MTNRVLIIANAVLASPDHLPARLTAPAAPPEQVLVVAPLLTTPLQALCSDIDAARRDAAKRLGYISCDLEALGMSPRMALGDQSQELTVDDALADFSADWCVVLNRLPECQTRAEQDNGRRICERSGLPTVVLTADGAGRLCEPSVRWRPETALASRLAVARSGAAGRASREDRQPLVTGW